MAPQLHHAEMNAWLSVHDGPLFDACVTNPPYHLSSIVKRFGKEGSAECKVGATGAYARAAKGFMGKEWDGSDVAFRPETWRAVYDRMKPGAHLVAFSGTRTYHRMACAIEDAGFEIRDMLCWHYGSGFPKSHNVGKGIDKTLGVERTVLSVGDPVKRMIPGADQAKAGWEKSNGREYRPTVTTAGSDEAAEWDGWGTALKPATEPICLARKPLSEHSIAANVLRWGTGAINIDGCRVSHGGDALGRWPANVITDGSSEVVAAFPANAGAFAPVKGTEPSNSVCNVYNQRDRCATHFHGDSGSAARFFYSAKAGPLDRLGSTHATVKPVDLMRWLCKLVTPPGGLILDPFAGSGTTGIAAMAEGFGCTMIEMEADHVADIERKLTFLRGEGGRWIDRHSKRKADLSDTSDGPLFEQVRA